MNHYRRFYIERFPDRNVFDRKIFENIHKIGTFKRSGGPGRSIRVSILQTLVRIHKFLFQIFFPMKTFSQEMQ